MTWIVALGTLAALCSTVSFVPQAWQIIRTRQTKDISAAMYAITVIGFGLWLGYGVMLKQWPLVASNGVCFLLSGFILLMKLLPGRGKEKIARAVTK